MNRTQTRSKIPVIGRVQHGEKVVGDNGKNKVIDYGYFIAKIQENEMKPYLDKFDQLIKGATSIDIQFLDDNPLAVRRERANQSGTICYCMEGQDKGKQKVKNLWQDIECKSDCTYLQKDSYGKSQCKRIAWLKFFIPQVATDRIWLMRITGQEAIENLSAYINVQKLMGNSLKNKIYTIFLTQKEQTDTSGKIHTNYVLDILQKSDFISHIPIPNNSLETLESTNTTETKTTTTQNSNSMPYVEHSNNVNMSENKSSQNSNENAEPISKEKKETTSQKITNKKETKNKSKSTSNTKSKKTENNTENSQENNSLTSQFDNCYVLLSTCTEKINGNDYFMAEFTDMQDNVSKIAIDRKSVV